MNKKIMRVVAVASSLALSLGIGSSVVSPALAVSSAATQHAAKPVSYKLLWAQDFNTKKAGAPDPKVWGYDVGMGVNGELEYNNKSTKNVIVDGKGHLLINAYRISDSSMNQTTTSKADGAILDRCGGYCQFVSGKIKTAGKVSFKYGRMEARIKVPAGLGTWPAFWMLGSSLNLGDTWPDCGEIDILETRGSMDNAAFGTIHGPGYSGGQGKGSVYDNGTTLTAGYHNFAIEWLPNVINFFVDGNQYFTVSKADVVPNTWVYNAKFFLILNLAMGGEFTGDIDPALNKAQLAVDYIHYYSINGQGKVYLNQ